MIEIELTKWAEDISNSARDLSKEISKLKSGMVLSDTELAVIKAMRGENKTVSGSIEVPVKVKVSVDMDAAEKTVVESLIPTDTTPKKTRKRRTKAEMAAHKAAENCEDVLIEEEIIVTNTRETASDENPAKKLTGLKPDASLPEVPEEITLNSVRNYTGAVMRSLDKGVEFHKAVNAAIKEAGVSEIALLEEDEVEEAFEVIQTVVAEFVNDQDIEDEAKFVGGK